MAKYACTVCGYVYDEDLGDEEQGLEPMAWDEMDDDFVCPLCGVGKEDFELVRD